MSVDVVGQHVPSSKERLPLKSAPPASPLKTAAPQTDKESSQKDAQQSKVIFWVDRLPLQYGASLIPRPFPANSLGMRLAPYRPHTQAVFCKRLGYEASRVHILKHVQPN